MNTIKIYLSSSGSLAELKKDFPLYQGAFNDKLLNVYVPTSLLPGTVDTQYVDETGFVHTEPGVFTALKIGMVSIGRDGRVNKTNAYYMRYLKKLMYQGIEYALYERALPQAFTLFEGQNSQAPKLIVNVVNMENNNEYNGEEIILGEPKILQVITSQQCSLDVLPSTSFDRDAFIEPSEWEIVNGKIDDLYEKYDYIVNNIDETIANYTYDKDTIDQKDTDTLQLAKDYADENFYNETDADERFVHLSGNETIADTKTFSASPIVPTPSANTHAVNRKYVTDNFYDKGQIGNLTSPISFSIEQNFQDWLAGEYVRPDGILPQDLLLGKKVIIQETGKNNYQVAYVPALSIECYKILVEDNKYASEIGFAPYKEIIATNTQEAVEQVKDEVDLKAQIIEMEDLTIETIDWVNDSGDIYFDYENESFTDPTKQFFEFVSNDKDQNEAIANDGFSILALETILDGADYKVRLFANKVPSIDILLKVNLINYTNEVFEAGEITANKIIYLNTISGLIATEVQSAIDELKGITDDLESDKVDKSAIKQTTGSSTTDIMSQKAISDELDLKATIVDVNNELGLKIDKSSIKQVIGSSTTDLMSQKAISDELDLKADKSDFQGTAGDIFYVNAIGELAKLPKSNNSFLGVSNTGEVEWVKTTNLTSSPYGVYLTEVVESGNVETTSQFYADGFRKYYILNPASGQPSFPIAMKGLVAVGFTNALDDPLFGSVVLSTDVTGYSHTTAYGISAVMDLTNVPNKYLIMKDNMSLVVMSTEETSIASYLARAYIVNYNATSSL